MLQNEILREVGAVARSIHSISDIKFRKLNLQKGQFIFLTRICENPGINLIDLSNMLRVDKTTTTKTIQKLVEEGYVLRERSLADKRMWHLFPSDTALKTYRFVIDEENRCIEVCFSNFSSDERAEAYRLLKKMRENIEAEWKIVKKT
ncbi:MarR family winged helix-turn-helix transcriptional regulator [Anaerosporomusa subterranea]|uniref:MarR family winged helix-turn-helix transcriptional regulator n=1 Tax=Anaerosporomusa subterranea TaxID=1794912 RepID=UPI000A51F468|nr:MarR family transcriptional regulator [Anaerosporomusa subterranea]